MKIKSKFLLVIFIVLSFSSILYARWWHNPKVAKELSLTKEQIAKMDRIFDDYLEFKRKSIKRIREIWDNLDVHFLDVNKTEIKKALNEIANLRHKILKRMVDAKLKIKGILNKKQIEIFRNKYPRLLKFTTPWERRRFKLPFGKMKRNR